MTITVLDLADDWSRITARVGIRPSGRLRLLVDRWGVVVRWGVWSLLIERDGHRGH